MCRDVFSRHTKNESDGARPAGTSRLQTQIRGESDGRRSPALFSLHQYDYTLQRCPAASSSSSSNGKISIFILLCIRSCHQTAWLRSTPGRHMGSQHAVSPRADLGSSQRTGQCVCCLHVCNCSLSASCALFLLSVTDHSSGTGVQVYTAQTDSSAGH